MLTLFRIIFILSLFSVNLNAHPPLPKQIRHPSPVSTPIVESENKPVAHKNSEESSQEYPEEYWKGIESEAILNWEPDHNTIVRWEPWNINHKAITHCNLNIDETVLPQSQSESYVYSKWETPSSEKVQDPEQMKYFVQKDPAFEKIYVDPSDLFTNPYGTYYISASSGQYERVGCIKRDCQGLYVLKITYKCPACGRCYSGKHPSDNYQCPLWDLETSHTIWCTP